MKIGKNILILQSFYKNDAGFDIQAWILKKYGQV